MIVLDTNVLSEAMRPSPDGRVLGWMNDQAAETLFLSSVTVAELLFGVRSLPHGRRRGDLTRQLDGALALFAGRVLPFDEAAALLYADMAVHARSAGRPLPEADGFIAATAAAHGFGIATRNIRDFLDTGVDLIDPWSAAGRV